MSFWRKAECLLACAGMVFVRETVGGFPPTQLFVVDISVDAEVQIASVSERFLVLYSSKIEFSEYGRLLCRCDVLVPLTDHKILQELGGDKHACTTLMDVWSVMRAQARGDPGDLLVDGRPNLFYVPDARGVVRAVRLSWDKERRGWIVAVFPFNAKDLLTWEGARVFANTFNRRRQLVASQAA